MVVRFFANLRDVSKAKETTIKAPETIRDLLYLLSDSYGRAMGQKLLALDGSLHPDMIVLLNGRHIEFLQGEETPLKEEDVVSFFPRIAGG
jgi:molybdopterin synthase sulfur carrier subunit